MVLNLLRRLRHGPFKRLSPLWLNLGVLFRAAARHLPLYTKMYIGPYGPFKLQAQFAFSDFAHWGGGHNEGFVACVERAREAACVIDVGAHIGLVTLPVSRVGNRARVIAFEPAEANRRLLEKHIKVNGIQNVEVVDAVVADSCADAVTFYEMRGPTGMNTMLGNKNPEIFHETTKRQVSLDDFCEAADIHPDLIKIDVEGAEIAVLKGAGSVLEKDRPTIVLSVHPTQLGAAGHDPRELFQIANDNGYKLTTINGSEIEQFALTEYLMIPIGAGA